MPEVMEIDLGRRARRLRVETLVRLRWLAVAGQTAAILVTSYGLGFPLPVTYCTLIIAASAWLNIGLRMRFALNHRLGDFAAAALLVYDVLQLSALLYLTGGLANPFSLLFLAPVTISAASLPPHLTLYIGSLTIAAVSVLGFWHLPLPWVAGEQLALPGEYLAGVWTAIVLGTAFVGIYASRVAEEARRLADALAATELVLVREQHLTQLDGLAAAAAHELGTPLATITLVVKELLSLVAEPGPVREDIVLLGQEATRCRNILGKLASLRDVPGGPLESMTVEHLLEEVRNPQRDFGVAIRIECEGSQPGPVCVRNSGVIYGLGNLIENAVDFARTEVVVKAAWTAETVVVAIRDDGPGFSPDVLSRLGEPYVTTRRDRRAKTEDSSGLGLGLFIAKTLLERSGATFTTANAGMPKTGAVVTMRWPRAVFERKRGEITSD